MCVRNSLSYSRRTEFIPPLVLEEELRCIFLLFGRTGACDFEVYSDFQHHKISRSRIPNFHWVKSIMSKSEKIEIGEHEKQRDISAMSAMKIGFLTNVLNPKATLFFLSLFTLVISPSTPFPVMLLMGVIMVVQTILWFSLVSILLTHKRVRGIFEKFQGVFNKTLGGLLIALGVKVALSQR